MSSLSLCRGILLLEDMTAGMSAFGMLFIVWLVWACKQYTFSLVPNASTVIAANFDQSGPLPHLLCALDLHPAVLRRISHSPGTLGSGGRECKNSSIDQGTTWRARSLGCRT